MGDLGDPFYEISRSLESSLSGLFQAFQSFINQAFLKSFYFATSKHHALVLKGSLSFDFMMEILPLNRKASTFHIMFLLNKIVKYAEILSYMY